MNVACPSCNHRIRPDLFTPSIGPLHQKELNMNRRDFLKTGAAALVGSSAIPARAPAQTAGLSETETFAGRSVSPLLLWYRQPAQQWDEALPIGNGRLGAMVFGGVSQERSRSAN
ncbi:MAG TPA: glycoside hydrolase N-terminal domain-containing protein [Chthoniobacterales bacterium]